MIKIELYKELLKILENEKKYKLEGTEYLLEIILAQERKTGEKILKYIDLTNISFENQNVEGIDFSFTNAKINPQEVKDKSLKNCILWGDFQGMSFDDVLVTGTNIKNAKNVNLNPQTVRDKTLGNAKLGEIDFKGKSFDDVYVFGTNFKNAKNVNLNPQTVRDKTLAHTNLCGIDFEGKSFDGVYIAGADFEGALNVKINPQKLLFKSLENVNATGVDFGNYSFEGVKVEGAQLEKSINCTYKKPADKNEYYNTLIKKSSNSNRVAFIKPKFDKLNKKCIISSQKRGII